MERNLSDSGIGKLTDMVMAAVKEVGRLGQTVSKEVGVLGGRVEGIGHEISNMRQDIRSQSTKIDKMTENMHQKSADASQRIGILENKVLGKKTPTDGSIDVRRWRSSHAPHPAGVGIDKKLVWMLTGAAIGGGTLVLLLWTAYQKLGL